MLNTSCCCFLLHSETNLSYIWGMMINQERKSLFAITTTYMVEPVFQNTIPNISDIANVFRNRTTLCSEFFQYAHLCFHRQAMHCALKFCQYLGGKCRLSVFGAGFSSSLTRSMFSLQKQNKVQIHCAYIFLIAQTN
jgi:hypothetical protein